MKALLIAEKPSLRQTLEQCYKRHRKEFDYDIKFMDQRGHLLQLKLPDELDESQKQWSWDKLPFHPEQHGGWQYKIPTEKKVGNFQTSRERFMAIKKEVSSGEYDFIINAGDPDQEGELLIREVLAALNVKIPVKRFWSNDLTDEKCVEALHNLRDDDHDEMLVNLLQAAYGRQRSDYRFGMNISRASTLKMGIRVAAGRVKTPILGIICKREKEIENFKPKTVYGVKAFYLEKFVGTYFDDKVAIENSEDKEGDKDEEQATGVIWFDKKEDAENFIYSLGNKATVEVFEKKRTPSYAPKLHKLASVQIAAGKYGYNAAQVLEIIQGLYEKKYLSYPRTECEYISSKENLSELLNSAKSIPSLKPFVESITNSDIARVRKTKKWVNDKELEKHGHSALIPTTNAPNFDDLSNDEQIIYDIICRQFVAIFLPPLIQDKTTIICDIDGNKFRTNGKILIDPGFTEIFGTNITDNDLPNHEIGDILDVENYEIAEKTSTCPKRYTDATLIQACENPLKYLEDEAYKSLGKNLKIGTPATRASIIEELITKNKYMERMNVKKTQYIIPTKTGMAIYDTLHDCAICKVDMTGEWEIMLEEIRNGEKTLAEFERIMIKDVESMIDEIKNLEVDTSGLIKKKTAIAKCPKCGGDIFSAEKGFFCSNWNKPNKEEGCKVGGRNELCGARISDKDFLLLLTGHYLKKNMTVVKKIEKMDENGKKKKASKTVHWDQEFCLNLENGGYEFKQLEVTTSPHKCPKCGGEMEETEKAVYCKKKDCYRFSKTIKGKTLTKLHIDNFFKTGKTGLIKGFEGKSGKPFDANIVMTDDYGISFQFSNNNNNSSSSSGKFGGGSKPIKPGGKFSGCKR